MSISIRLAEPRDDVAIGELLVHSFLEQYAKKLPDVVLPAERLVELRAVGAKRAVATVWVAEVENVVVGTVAVWAPGTPGSEAWVPGAFDLRHLAVASAARGLGVSHQLLDTAEGFARAAGAPAVSLHVRRGAVGVARLYQQRGFVRAPEGDRDLPSLFLEAYCKLLQA